MGTIIRYQTTHGSANPISKDVLDMAQYLIVYLQNIFEEKFMSFFYTRHSTVIRLCLKVVFNKDLYPMAADDLISMPSGA